MKRVWMLTMVGAAVGCTGTHYPTSPAARPLAVASMAGPFATIDAYCATAIDEQRARDPEEPEVECWAVNPDDERAELMPDAALPAGPTALAPPFRTAVFVAVGFNGPTCAIAVETDGGWYGATLGSACGHRDSRSSSHLELLELAVRDLLPGGAPELMVRLREAERYADLDGDGGRSTIESETLRVCGVGPSGRPSCVEPIEVVRHETTVPGASGGRLPGNVQWERTVDYRADSIVLRGGPADRSGRHPIVFR